MINPPHPGESVQECIDEAGMTAKESQSALGSLSKLREYVRLSVKGKCHPGKSPCYQTKIPSMSRAHAP